MGGEQAGIRDWSIWTACATHGRTTWAQQSSSGLQKTDCSGSAWSPTSSTAARQHDMTGHLLWEFCAHVSEMTTEAHRQAVLYDVLQVCQRVPVLLCLSAGGFRLLEWEGGGMVRDGAWGRACATSPDNFSRILSRIVQNFYLVIKCTPEPATICLVYQWNFVFV